MLKNSVILAVGVAIGYFIAQEVLDKKYSNRADEEILEAETHYLRMTAEAEKHYEDLEEELRKKYRGPTIIAESLVEPSDLFDSAVSLETKRGALFMDELKEKQKEVEEVGEDGDDAGFSNPLVDAQPSGDELLDNAQKAFRNYNAYSTDQKPKKPPVRDDEPKEETVAKPIVSVISQLEFEMNEPDHDQTTLVYYVSDNILTDAVTDKVLDIAKALGVLDQAWFGDKCDDENTCHLRNNAKQLDFEIVRESGSYAATVLGQGDNA